jgi:4-amino-4-deoxy-L-arabinose transferase-like glycosyltransferase
MPRSHSAKTTTADVLYLAAVASFFLLFGLNRGSLASWDEALYASVAKNIFRSGDWLRFTFGGVPWTDKPPLALWATALSFKLFGVNEFAARFFSASCGVGAVIVTYLLASRLFGRWVGLLSAMVLLNSSHFLRFARFGMMDGPLMFFLSLSLYFFWRGRERNRYLIFSGIAFGLALMTKGFAAFIIVPVIVVYAVWADDLELLAKSSYWVGVMVAVAIALPWHLWELTMNRELFMRDVVVKHLFSRTLTALEGHEGNWYFYIRTAINKYHPWILVAVASAPYFLFRAAKSRRSEFVFVSSWLFVVLAIITLIRTKLPWYILPLYPPLSITVGYALAKALREKHAAFVKAGFVAAMALHIPLSHLINADYSRDIKGISAEVRAKAPADALVHLYNYHESPAAEFYLERRNSYIDDTNTFVVEASKPGFYCLIHDDDWPAAKAAVEAKSLAVKPAASFEDLLFVTNA